MASVHFKMLSENYGINLDIPVKDLPQEHLNILLFGNDGEKFQMQMNTSRYNGSFNASFEGIVNNLSRRYKETNSEYVKFEIGKFMREIPCRVCGGKRLNEKALSIKIDGKDIDEMSKMSVICLLEYFKNLCFEKQDAEIAKTIVKEIMARLEFLRDVGLDYLTLSRSAETLSGGESQRIRLATQIGSGLVGVLYILDEPSIGLHQRDNDKLLATLKKLKDLGNTLIVVEHDEDTIRMADYIVDVGPKAGVHGGEIVVAGSVEDVKNTPNSITGQYLSGKEKIEYTLPRRTSNKFLEVVGAKQNNLKEIDVKIPVGVFTAITGVSGSGKSSLVNGVLYPYLSNNLNRSSLELGEFKEIKNIENFDKVIMIDQAPIGRTPRSNPATYTGVWTPIRELFASTVDAKQKGYTS